MLHLQKFEKACPFSKQFLCTDFKTGSNFLNLKNYIGEILNTNKLITEMNLFFGFDQDKIVVLAFLKHIFSNLVF